MLDVPDFHPPGLLAGWVRSGQRGCLTKTASTLRGIKRMNYNRLHFSPSSLFGSVGRFGMCLLWLLLCYIYIDRFLFRRALGAPFRRLHAEADGRWKPAAVGCGRPAPASSSDTHGFVCLIILFICQSIPKNWIRPFKF